MWVTAREALGRSSNDRWVVLSYHRVPTVCVPSPFSSPPTDSLPLVTESPLGTDRIILSLAEGPIPVHVMLGVGGVCVPGALFSGPTLSTQGKMQSCLGGASVVPSAGDRGTRLHTRMSVSPPGSLGTLGGPVSTPLYLKFKKK